MRKIQIVLLSVALAIGSLVPVPVLAFAQVSSIDSSEAQSAILSAGTRASHIGQVRKVPSVGVIDLSGAPRSISQGTDATYAEFRIMAEKNYAGIRSLQRALSRNPLTRAAIARTGVAVGNIVGVSVSSNGSLRLFILR